MKAKLFILLLFVTLGMADQTCIIYDEPNSDKMIVCTDDETGEDTISIIYAEKGNSWKR